MKRITLEEVIRLLKEKELYAGQSGEKEVFAGSVIEQLSYNSVEVKENALFFCKGVHFKKEYLADAFDKGAVCYISEAPVIEEFPHILVTDIRKAMVKVSEAFYENIWNEKLQMVGVTGTKGKTTTTFFTKAIMDSYTDTLGLPGNGLMTGEYTYDGKNKEEAILTTPEIFDLHRHLAACAENGCRYLVMEASSQALKYGRTDGIAYKVGVFLNLGEDHISDIEHPDMEDYFNSKMRLFAQSETACLNRDLDDELYAKAHSIAEAHCRRVITFGLTEEADVYAYDIEATLEELDMKVRYQGRIMKLHANMGGYYNAKNIVAAVSVAIALGIPEESIIAGVARGKAQGRLEVFDLPNKKDVKLIFDYAHNEMSYNALFDSINRACPGRKKIFIFGLTGDRAYSRRKMGGEIADREADRVVLTQVTPGSEDPYDICCQIRSYISPDKEVTILVNRKEAIRYALDTVEDGWLVVFIGFSSPYSQKINGKFEKVESDMVTVKNYIAEHGGKMQG